LCFCKMSLRFHQPTDSGGGFFENHFMLLVKYGGKFGISEGWDDK